MVHWTTEGVEQLERGQVVRRLMKMVHWTTEGVEQLERGQVMRGVEGVKEVEVEVAVVEGGVHTWL